MVIAAILMFSAVCAGMAIVGFRDLKAVRKPAKKRVRAATA
jgi:hypothetical protein